MKLRDIEGFGGLIFESAGLGINSVLDSLIIDGSIIILSMFAFEDTVAYFEVIRNMGLNISRIIGIRHSL